MEPIILDGSFVDQFNQSDSDHQHVLIDELFNLPMTNKDEDFRPLEVSAYFVATDLKAKDHDVETKLSKLLYDHLRLNEYYVALAYTQMIGQRRHTPFAGFNSKNEPLVFHMYKMFTGRSLKRDLNLQQQITYNPETVLIAPVDVYYHEVILHQDEGYDIRMDVEPLIVYGLERFLLQDQTILAIKIYLSLALRGYFGSKSPQELLDALPPQYVNHYQFALDFQLQFSPRQPSEHVLVVDNDDRTNFELAWLVTFCYDRLGHHELAKKVAIHIKEQLSEFTSEEEHEAFAYLYTLKEAFNYFLTKENLA